MVLNQHEFYAARWVTLNRLTWVNLNRHGWITINRLKWVSLTVFSNSLADSALAFASNSHGRKAVSIETNISHLKTVHENDLLRATAHLKSISNKIGLYEVEITNQNGILVALFKGTVYRTSEEW